LQVAFRRGGGGKETTYGKVLRGDNLGTGNRWKEKIKGEAMFHNVAPMSTSAHELRAGRFGQKGDGFITQKRGTSKRSNLGINSHAS